MSEHDLIQAIRQTIDAEVRPWVERDGGRIELKHFAEGTVYVKLSGACEGCSVSHMTLKLGVERTLRRRFVQVNCVKLWES